MIKKNEKKKNINIPNQNFQTRDFLSKMSKSLLIELQALLIEVFEMINNLKWFNKMNINELIH